MQIVRPNHIKTSPDKLGEQLRVPVVKVGEWGRAKWGRDFFMYYPSPDFVDDVTDEYRALRRFYRQDKFSQRQSLAAVFGGLVLETTASYRDARGFRNHPDGYVVRPMHHEAGEGYRFTDDALDFDEGKEYIGKVFPKTHEYRVVLVYGKLAFMQKKQGGVLGPKDCWSNVPFTYIRDVDRSYLKVHTDFFDQVKKSGVLMSSCIAGVDVLYNHQTKQYRICEVNTCPVLTAPTYAEGRELRGKIINIIKEKHQ